MMLFHVESGNGCLAFIASVFLGIIFPTGLALAQNCPMTEIIQDGNDLDERYINNIKCAAARLLDAERRIGDLEKDIAQSRAATGMVIAFNRDRTSPCPQGWKLFAPAGGRVVVGAGDNQNKDINGFDLSDHTVGVVGGEEKHKLKPEEMPSHSHQSNIADIRHLGIVSEAGGNVWSSSFELSDTQPQGGDVPHNTMPPFVALYYCIKE